MLRVVTTNNAEVFRHFGSKAFHAIGVDQSIGTDFDSVLALVHEHRPQVAIIDVDLPGRDGYAVCRAIKDDPELSGVRVMLILGSFVSRAELAKVDASGCDDLLALPMHTDDFHHHIAQVTGVPYRRNDRLARSVDARFVAAPPGVDLVRVEDISLGGIGAVTTGEPRVDQSVAIQLSHDGVDFPALTARVAWVSELDGGDKRVGLGFSDLPIEVRMLMESLCLFEAHEEPDGTLSVSIHGVIAERTNLAPLAAKLADADTIDFNLRELRYLSSIGVRRWIDLLASLDGKSYSFRHASMAFTSQVAMMPAVAGRGAIVSFEAPYRCDDCDRDDQRLLETKTLAREGDDVLPPVLHCTACGGELVFDDLPARYLAFVFAAQ